MSTPTDQQQIRTVLRRLGRNVGPTDGAIVVMSEAIELLGREPVEAACRFNDVGSAMVTELPPLLGASEAADVLGMKATNLKRLSPPLPVAAVISGRIPVYRESDVLDAKRRRDARRAA